MSEIQKKIKDGEGMLKVESLGWITAAEHDRLTDPKTNPDTYEEMKKLKILDKPTKNDYDINGGGNLKIKKERMM